jgi:hypothetical protein
MHYFQDRLTKFPAAFPVRREFGRGEMGSIYERVHHQYLTADNADRHDINAGVVNIIVGFAPPKPAEFVIITLQQMVAKPNPS